MSQEENNWYESFLETIANKFPRKQDLVQELIDLLYIEREAVYRRLRQDVFFTAHEIAKISVAWNISLDDILNSHNGCITFQMRKMNYVTPSDEEQLFLRKVINGIIFGRSYPNTEYMDICNKLPRQFLAGYEYLNQFYLFKWLYQYGKEKDMVPLSKVTVSNEQSELTKEYYDAIKTVPNSNFVFDRMLFDYLVSDIQYFYSIQMITAAEKALIKQDLYDLLDYLQKMANKGYYPETKNKVNLYVSHLHVDTNYNYVFTPEASICFVHVFEKFEIYSFNSEMFNNFRAWMQLKKRSSVQISEVDERSRIAYFSDQRKLVDLL